MQMQHKTLTDKAFVCFPEKELSALHKKNRKNAVLAVAVGLLVALIYAWWTV